MAIESIRPENSEIAALLDRARQEPLVLRSATAGDFALLPVDDDVLDLLLERDPVFIQESREIRKRMEQGDYLTLEQVLAALDEGGQA
jgi:hypothetical protein